ncbi:hypothetical protein ACEQPO_28145 [Bacillus sp. SL00103]
MYKKMHTYTITPGQVANVPQGWWHYEVALQDRTHLLAIFNASTPEVILGSDLLTPHPAHIMAHTYCMNETKWETGDSACEARCVYPDHFATGKRKHKRALSLHLTTSRIIKHRQTTPLTGIRKNRCPSQSIGF